MKKIVFIFILAVCAGCGREEKQNSLKYGETVVIGKLVLQDKIKGGWAGQTIGCTYGGPTEFKYKGGLINSRIPIIWYDNYAGDTFIEDPGLYDDVYMDLTFMEVMAKHGIDTPAETYALAFANADYKLWHANQAARYNILQGIMPPLSGHWTKNPHADDIDFQIESDFIGMICPGMMNTATDFADKIGHIMNYGDGWYGGVYMAAMYALAFVTDDIPLIVTEALKTIPEETKFYNCIKDVVKYWEKYPTDWQQCWFEIEKQHGYDIGCPEGVFNGFNIDATINAAYVVIGLLYGEGDFFKTMDIATRCGQDSDCNPASAAGILGVMKGYEAIPDYWKPAIEKVEQLDFPYTTISLQTAYALTLKLIGDVLEKQGGSIKNDNYYITLQQPEKAAYEVSFAGLYPVEKRVLKKKFRDVLTVKFNGNSIVLLGQITQTRENEDPYVALLEACIDGEKVENFKMPYDYIKRKYDIFSIYNLPVDSTHELTIRLLNPHPDYVVEAKEMVVYATTPAATIQPY